MTSTELFNSLLSVSEYLILFSAELLSGLIFGFVIALDLYKNQFIIPILLFFLCVIGDFFINLFISDFPFPIRLTALIFNICITPVFAYLWIKLINKLRQK